MPPRGRRSPAGNVAAQYGAAAEQFIGPGPAGRDPGVLQAHPQTADLRAGPTGTFVMHPGIVPEYRNAHGCFWALVHGDLGRVGMSLLKIDAGIDTGPVYGYFTTPVNEWTESHIGIQRRMTFENLPAIAERLVEIHNGTGAADPHRRPVVGRMGTADPFRLSAREVGRPAARAAGRREGAESSAERANRV